MKYAYKQCRTLKNEKPRKIEKIKNLKVGLGAKFCVDSEYEKKKMGLLTNLTVIT